MQPLFSNSETQDRRARWGGGGGTVDVVWAEKNKCVSYLFPSGATPLTLLKAWQVLWMFVSIKFSCLSNPQILLHGFQS